MVEVNRPKDGDNLSEAGKGAGKLEHVARENQVGKPERTIGKATENVLPGVRSDAELLGQTDSKKAQERLAKADVAVDPKTGWAEELKSPNQVRKVAQTGAEEVVRTHREAELKAAIDSGDAGTITKILEKNNRESKLWQEAHNQIAAQLQTAKAQVA